MDRQVRNSLMSLVKSGRGGRVDAAALGRVREVVRWMLAEPEVHGQQLLDTLDVIEESTTSEATSSGAVSIRKVG